MVGKKLHSSWQAVAANCQALHRRGQSDYSWHAVVFRWLNNVHTSNLLLATEDTFAQLPLLLTVVVYRSSWIVRLRRRMTGWTTWCPSSDS